MGLFQNTTPKDVKFYVHCALNTGSKMNFESAISIAAIVFNMNTTEVRRIMFDEKIQVMIPAKGNIH